MGKTIDLRKWTEKHGITSTDLLKIKAKAGKKVSEDEKVLVLYEYMSQLEKLPSFDKITYKKTVSDVCISPRADEMAENIKVETLVDVLANRITPILSGYDSVGYFYEFPIIWGSSSKKYRKSNLVGEMNSEEEYYMEYLDFYSQTTDSDAKSLERLLPFCRYASSEGINHIIKFVDTMEKAKSSRLKVASIVGRSGLLLSDTDEARDYLDKHGLLYKYNAMRE